MYYSYATTDPTKLTGGKHPHIRHLITTPVKQPPKAVTKTLPPSTTTSTSSDSFGKTIPVVLMAGGALAAGVSFLLKGKQWPLFVSAGLGSAGLGGYLYYTKTVINNPFPGVWSWLQGYSIYMAVVGLIGLYIFRGIHSTAFGILGQLFFLGLLVISSGIFLTNFMGLSSSIPGVLAQLPDVGTSIRKTINPKSN